MKQIIIDGQSAGKKLFRFLQSKVLTQMQNSDIFRVIRQGKIKINGKKKPHDYILQDGDEIKIWLPDNLMMTKANPTKYKGISANIDILYEDERIIVINKPIGVPVHAADNRHNHNITDSVRAYLYKKSNSPTQTLYEASPCHRLDTNTTGVLIFAKTQADLAKITGIFRERTCRKIYNAVVYGNLANKITICSDIDTSQNNQNKVSVHNLQTPKNVPNDYDGCITIAVPQSNSQNVTFCEIELLTGKKHQIRAHLCAVGHPLIGDQKYFTQKSAQFSRENRILTYMLHCCQIELPGYGVFTAPLPDNMKKFT